MYFRIKDRFNRAMYSFACREIERTPAVELDPSSDLALLSQIQHKDVAMYLMALKSFASRVKPQAVYILNDGSLTRADVDRLKRHVPALNLLQIQDYRGSVCPTGGTWERLQAIAQLVDRHYIIQLDADTLTTGPLGEVKECLASGTSFVIGTWDKQDFETMSERCQEAKRSNPRPDAHVQQVTEANLDKLSAYSRLRYVRGCSGFSGFARRSFHKEFIEGISQEMERAIGAKWREWGSEQVMSNIVVANIEKSRVLPHPKYSSCRKMSATSVFTHFVGICRFRKGIYARLSRREIDRLQGRQS